jgi:hypothetical protein
MNSRKEELSKTISMLELELEYMHKFLNYVPAPCIVYTKDGRISWCNKPMLNLFFGTVYTPEHTRKESVFGKHVTDVMPDYLWPYVLEQNEIVLDKEHSQYEDWSDNVWVSCEWKRLRFPIGKYHIGVILFPKEADDLARCDAALKLERN